MVRRIAFVICVIVLNGIACLLLAGSFMVLYHFRNETERTLTILMRLLFGLICSGFFAGLIVISALLLRESFNFSPTHIRMWFIGEAAFLFLGYVVAHFLVGFW